MLTCAVVSVMISVDSLWSNAGSLLMSAVASLMLCLKKLPWCFSLCCLKIQKQKERVLYMKYMNMTLYWTVSESEAVFTSAVSCSAASRWTSQTQQRLHPEPVKQTLLLWVWILAFKEKKMFILHESFWFYFHYSKPYVEQFEVFTF